MWFIASHFGFMFMAGKTSNTHVQDDADSHNVLRLYDYFYHKEHLFLVTELLKDNLYEFQRYLTEAGEPPYFTIARLQRISKQTLEALAFIHARGLIHCDLKVSCTLPQYNHSALRQDATIRAHLDSM